MTSIVANSVTNNKFSVTSFYLARARRLLPALILLCSVLLIFGFAFLLPSDFRSLGKHIASSIGFISNITYWLESGYFTTSAHEKWLLHTWSLSVEWQFYLIFPFFMLALYKLFYRKYSQVFLCITILGFIVSLFISLEYPDAAFYLLPARFWELLIGGCVFFFSFNISFKAKKMALYLGLFLIILSFYILTESALWPGYLSLIPVIGSCLILYSNDEKSFFSSNSILRWIGERSYSIYLWHWPVVVYLSYLGHLNSTSHILLGILFIATVSHFSYTKIENVFKKKTRKNEILITSVAIVIAIGAASVFFLNGIISEYRPISVSPKSSYITEYKVKHNNLGDAYWLKCNVYTSITENNNENISDSCTVKNSEEGVFLWGDSHAEALSFGLRALLPNNISFYQVTSASCPPSFEPSTKNGIFKKACNISNTNAIEKITRLKPTVVILAQSNSHEERDWNEMFSKLNKIGVSNVVLVGPVPQWRPSLPIVIAKRHWKSKDLYVIDPALDENIVNTAKKLRNPTFNQNLHYINLFDHLCSEIDDGLSCKVKLESGELLVVDHSHLSEGGSFYIVENFILPKLESFF